MQRDREAVRCFRTRKEEEERDDEDEDDDVVHSGSASLCPSCKLNFDLPLILPCSHTLCSRCVGDGGRGPAGRGRRPSPPLIARGHTRGYARPVVLCPCCQDAVELPCWDWTSARHCLPAHPIFISRPPPPPSYSVPDSPAYNLRAFISGPPPPLPPLSSCAPAEPIGRDSDQGASQIYPDTRDVTGPSSMNESSSYSSPLDGNVDLTEDDMEKSVTGLSFILDPSSSSPSLSFSNSSLTVTFKGSTSLHGNGVALSGDPPGLPLARADVVITRGQYYWEVDVCNSALYRIGVISLDGGRGWWLERRGMSFWVEYDGSRETLRAVPPQIKTLGVFLNVGGGVLSFHNPLAQEHLATLPTRFSPSGVYPALALAQGRLRLCCGLPPPPHVFLSRASGYRGPLGAGGGPWRRDVPFRSVRTVIQKFEELAVSESDSGLVSSHASSCSTLASLLDPAADPEPSVTPGPEPAVTPGPEPAADPDPQPAETPDPEPTETPDPDPDTEY